MRYWSENDSRMGLHTIQRRKLTGRGIKPQGKMQWDFIYLWLYGAVKPLTGESFFYEFTHLDTVCFDKLLELFTSKYRLDLHIIQVDKVGFHNSLNLSIPERKCDFIVSTCLQPGGKPHRKTLGVYKRTIEMVEI